MSKLLSQKKKIDSALVSFIIIIIMLLVVKAYGRKNHELLRLK